MKEDRNRISRVTTRSGDQGESSLADGSRMAKDAAPMEAMGELDELGSAIGVLVARQPGEDIEEILLEVQQKLFDLGAEIALPGTAKLTDTDVEGLEQWQAQYSEALPPLKEFVLAGGAPAAAWCHHVRTLARRAERRLVHLHHQQAQNPASLRYLNRLSDLLFVLARTLNHRVEHPEILWRNPVPPSG